MRYPNPGIFIVMLLATISVPAGLLWAGAEKPDAAKIDGEWKLVGVERGGRKLPDEAFKDLPGILAISGEKIRGMVGDKVIYEANFVVDTAKSPKEYEMSGGKDRKGRDIITRGIFEIDANGRLRKCFTTGANAKAPKSFDTKENPGSQLNIYERVK